MSCRVTVSGTMPVWLTFQVVQFRPIQFDWEWNIKLADNVSVHTFSKLALKYPYPVPKDAYECVAGKNANLRSTMA